MNRELSWLKFNERVLDEAKREGVPLCERLTFCQFTRLILRNFQGKGRLTSGPEFDMPK